MRNKLIYDITIIICRSDQEHTMQEVYNTVPFVLKKGRNQIEVVDPMAADILDMETISDFFEPSAPTFVDYLWGFFTGKKYFIVY